MPSKKRTLYEFLPKQGMSTVTASRRNGVRSHVDADELVEQERSSLLGAGRSIRLPVGYLFVSVAVVMVLLVGAYLFGYQRGGSAGSMPETLANIENHRIGRELGGGDPPAGDGGAGQTPRENAASPGMGTAGFSGGSSAGGFGDIELTADTDPREEGKNYIYLIETTRDGALRVANFCRDNGLEAYVIEANNGNSRVFVLPGYVADDRDSPRIKELRRAIDEDIRVKWRMRHGRDELSSFPEKYRG